MEDIIELPKPRTPWKTITAGALMLFACGGYCSLSLYNQASDAFVEWKNNFIEQEVENYLKANPIVIDDRDKKKPLPPEVRREDLLKMVYVTHARMSQCEMNMKIIKDTIDFTESQK